MHNAWQAGVRRSSVSFLIKLAAFQASGWAEHSKHLLIAIPNRNCLTHLGKQSACKDLINENKYLHL